MYRWVEHTSELELELEAPSECELLGEGMTALAELLSSDSGAGDVTAKSLERRTVEATARDRPSLLAAWLEELLFLAESVGLIAVRLERCSVEDQRVVAEVSARAGDPRPFVKAVTYHRLEFESTERGYRGRVVFDV